MDKEQIAARLEWIAATGSSVLLSPVETRALAALFPALVADANRYRAVRALLCEPDESKRDIVFVAVDAFMCGQTDLDDDGTLTPERWDEVVDGMLQAARDAK